jgi:hypothetical protein
VKVKDTGHNLIPFSKARIEGRCNRRMLNRRLDLFQTKWRDRRFFTWQVDAKS